MLAAWVRDIDPFALELWNGFGLRWYGLAYVAGFLIAWLMLRVMIRRGLTPLPASRAGDFVLFSAIAGVVGGRLGYAVLYRPDLFVSFSGRIPFWDLLDISQGGMASHGGMAGAALAAWWFGRGFRNPADPQGERIAAAGFLHYAELMTLVAPPGLALGRIANFVNGELLGRVVAPPGEPAPWWAVKFPQEIGSGHRLLSPAESQRLDQIVAPYLPQDPMIGPNEAFSIAYDTVVRHIQRGEQLGRRLAEDLAPLLAARHPSQLYQAVVEGLLLGAVLLAVWYRPRVPGVIAATFLISYGLGRIATEYWRLPDAHLKVQQVLGLSRGQWLSVGMVAAGALLLLWIIQRARRRRARGEPLAKYGGWGQRQSG
jgi:phosphatidylglycerol---prolipoprotein diacylglyceryl transferase